MLIAKKASKKCNENMRKIKNASETTHSVIRPLKLCCNYYSLGCVSHRLLSFIALYQSVHIN